MSPFLSISYVTISLSSQTKDGEKPEEERFDTYDHYTNSQVLPRYRDATTRSLLQNMCNKFIENFVLNEDDEFRFGLSVIVDFCCCCCVVVGKFDSFV
jgi:hypothetical protein